MFSTNFRFVSSIIIHVNFMNPVILKAFNITKLYISFEDKSIKQLNTAYYLNSCLYVHNLQINTPNLPRFFRTFELDRLSSLSWIKFYDIILILIFITINKNIVIPSLDISSITKNCCKNNCSLWNEKPQNSFLFFDISKQCNIKKNPTNTRQNSQIHIHINSLTTN